MMESTLRYGGVGLALLLVGLTLASSRTLACVVGSGTGPSCTESALTACLPAGGSFDGTVTFNCSASPVTITVTSTKIISADTIIDGGNMVTISGGNSVGVFSVNTGVNFTVGSLTIASGRSSGDGGAIYSIGGTLTITNSTFSGNSSNSGNNGGAITSGGMLTVTNSTFSGNRAGFYGGGILNAGILRVIGSTFSGNSGGGIFSEDGTLTVTNSTFSGNSGTGVASWGSLTVTNSTFFDNRAGNGGYGGGIFNYFGAPATVTNTILAKNTSAAAGNCYGGVITDGGHNIDDDGSCGFSGSSLSNVKNLMLDPTGLADNGGRTQTIALEAGSPAIHAGDESICAGPPVNDLDQRGYGRPGAGATACSIGAYEYDAVTPSAPATPTGSPGTASTRTATRTPTPGPVACIGDCDGAGEVTINELILLVNIALGSAQPSACPNGIPSGAAVDVSVIIEAVTNALCGCGVPCPTPAATSTRTNTATPTATPTFTATLTHTPLPPTATPTVPAVGQVLFKEGWEKSAVQRYGAISVFNGDTGGWENGTNCFGTTVNYAQVIVQDGSHQLTLHSGRSASCDDDSQFVEPAVLTNPVGPRDLNLPFDDYTFLSFRETGALADPDPCDAVLVSVLFDQDQVLTYVLQRGSQWDTSPNSCLFGSPALGSPILLPADQGAYVRNLSDDAASVGIFPESVHYITLYVASHGDATFDDITFFRAAGAPPLPTPTPTPKPGNCVRVQQGTWCLTFASGDDFEGPLSQSGCSVTFAVGWVGSLNGSTWEASILGGDTITGNFIGNPATSFRGTIDAGGQQADVTGAVGACSGD